MAQQVKEQQFHEKKSVVRMAWATVCTRAWMDSVPLNRTLKKWLSGQMLCEVFFTTIFKLFSK